MSHHQRYHSVGSVPFSWEHRPGVSKVTTRADGIPDARPKLPLPPCHAYSPRLSCHGLYVPLPPCPFQPLPRSSERVEKDPFLAAYMECTKSVRPSPSKLGSKRINIDAKQPLKRFGCKHSCGVSVREDSVVRLSQLKRVLANKPEKKWIAVKKSSTTTTYEA